MPEAMGPGWTDDRVAMLKKLWVEDGLSASRIARHLGGVTRNAVIGKVHRLKLCGLRSPEVVRANYERGYRAMQAGQAVWKAAQPAPILPPSKPRRIPNEDRGIPEPPVRRRALRLVPDAPVGAAERPAPVLTLVPPAGAPEPRHLTLMQLGTAVCRWPIGEGVAMTFCGCATPDPGDPAQPYCAFHRGRAYQPGKPRQLTPDKVRPGWVRGPATRSRMFREAAGGR